MTLADGTQVRLRHEFVTTHVDVRRPGQEPTYQGVVHPRVSGKGWPAQFATGKASGQSATATAVAFRTWASDGLYWPHTAAVRVTVRG